MSQDRSYRQTFLPWGTFTVTVILVHLFAAVSYVQTAVRIRPDVKKSFVEASCSEIVGIEQEGLVLHLQAKTLLPSEGADFDLSVREGLQWLEIPNSKIHLDDGHQTLDFKIQVTRRPESQAADVILALSPVNADLVKVSESSFNVVIAPRPNSSQPTLRITASPSVLVSQDRFQIRVEIQHPGTEKNYQIQLSTDSMGAKLLREPERNLVLKSSQPVQILDYALRSRLSELTRVSIRATDTQSQLRAETQVEILPSTVPLVEVEITSPETVSPGEREIVQTVSLTDKNQAENVRLILTHDGAMGLSPSERSVELSRAAPETKVLWNVVTPPLMSASNVTFQVTGNRVKAVDPWVVKLQPLLSEADGNKALLVVIDTVLISAEHAPWFSGVMRETLQSHRSRLRGESVLVLRKGNAPELWDGQSAFGAENAYDAESSGEAFGQLAKLLQADDRAEGPVIVVWASGFAPPAIPKIPYPVRSERPFRFLWADVKAAQELGLFGDWQSHSSKDDFQLQFLLVPQDVLKNILDSHLQQTVPK